MKSLYSKDQILVKICIKRIFEAEYSANRIFRIFLNTNFNFTKSLHFSNLELKLREEERLPRAAAAVKCMEVIRTTRDARL